MKICNDQSITGSETRLFPDARNMPKPRWRAAFDAIIGPAMRIHKYRNLRSAMFYDAICHVDCDK